jgi:hypothetical protein
MNAKLKMLLGFLATFSFQFSCAQRAEDYLKEEDQYEEMGYKREVLKRFDDDKKNCGISSNDCDNLLKLRLLCACRIRVACLEAQCISADQVDTDVLNTGSFCAQSVKSPSVCADRLGVNDSACIATLTSNDIQVDTLCVTGQVRLNEICGRYRAVARLSADTLYTLGDPINFDLIVDDPDGDVTLAPFEYHVPVSGYYIINMQVNQRDLAAADPILGTPTANLQLLVNGNPARDVMSPFLTFSNQQQSNMSAVLRLNAGDVVTARYLVDILTDTGFQFLVGTVILEDGVTATEIVVHYLSSICEAPIPCTPRPCQPCDTSCNVQPCAPCFPCNL